MVKRTGRHTQTERQTSWAAIVAMKGVLTQFETPRFSMYKVVFFFLLLDRNQHNSVHINLLSVTKIEGLRKRYVKRKVGQTYNNDEIHLCSDFIIISRALVV